MAQVERRKQSHGEARTQRPKGTTRPARRTGKAGNKSWAPGRKGQGGEGFSTGYGGSAGSGTGASGPEDGSPR
jgi:hypothetical protein